MSILDSFSEYKDKIEKARELGKSDSEIFDYMVSKGLVENPLDKYSDQEKINKARELGKSDFEIADYLVNKGLIDLQPTGMQGQPTGMQEQPTGTQEQPTGIQQQPTDMQEQVSLTKSASKYTGHGRNKPRKEVNKISFFNWTDRDLENFKEEVKKSPTQALTKLISGEVQEPEDILTKAKAFKELPSDAFDNIWGEKYTNGLTKTADELNQYITSKLRQFGYDVIYDRERGDILYTKEGEEKILEPKAILSLIENRGAVAGSVLGAIEGAKIAPPSPKAKAIGALVGGAVGAVSGTYLDKFRQAVELKEDLDKKLVLRQMIENGIADVLGSTIGLGVGKLANYSLPTLKNLLNNLSIKNYNAKRAWETFKDLADVTDEQADEAVKKLEEFYQTKMEGGEAAKKLKAMILTEPGSEKLLSSLEKSPKAMVNLSRFVSKKYEELTDLAKSFTHKKVGGEIIQELKNYEDGVKEFYSNVYKQAEKVKIPAEKYNPYEVWKGALLKDVIERAENPAVQIRLQNILDKIEDKSLIDNLSKVINLRKEVSEVSRKIRLDKDKKKLEAVAKSLDNYIEKLGRKHLGKRWIDNYKKANIEYAKMKALESNILVKAIKNAKGDEIIIDRAVARAASKQEVINQVLAKLPQKTREVVEGKVLNELINSASAGKGDYAAIHFPILADKLDNVRFYTSDATKAKWLIKQMAEVFKNDAILDKATGTVKLSQFQSSLSDSLVAKARYELVMRLYRMFRRYTPISKISKHLNLAETINELLEEPMNVKAIKELHKMIPETKGLTKALEEYQKNYTQFGEQDLNKQFIKVYRATSKKFARRNYKTMYGKGKQFYTDLKDVEAKKLDSQNIESKTIPVDRLANENDIREAMGVPEFTLRDLRKNKNNYVQKLKTRGFVGTMIDNTVILYE